MVGFPSRARDGLGGTMVVALAPWLQMVGQVSLKKCKKRCSKKGIKATGQPFKGKLITDKSKNCRRCKCKKPKV